MNGSKSTLAENERWNDNGFFAIEKLAGKSLIFILLPADTARFIK